PAAGPGSAPAPPEARHLRGTRQMRQTARPVPWSTPHIRLRFDHRPRHNLPLGALPVHGARGYVQQVFRRPVIEPQPPRLHTIGFPESDETESFTTRRVSGPGVHERVGPRRPHDALDALLDERVVVEAPGYVQAGTPRWIGS